MWWGGVGWWGTGEEAGPWPDYWAEYLKISGTKMHSHKCSSEISECNLALKYSFHNKPTLHGNKLIANSLSYRLANQSSSASLLWYFMASKFSGQVETDIIFWKQSLLNILCDSITWLRLLLYIKIMMVHNCSVNKTTDVALCGGWGKGSMRMLCLWPWSMFIVHLLLWDSKRLWAKLLQGGSCSLCHVITLAL